MSEIETYSAKVPDWATAFEFVVHEPLADDRPAPTRRALGGIEVVAPPRNLFLVAVVATPNSLIAPFLDARIVLTDPFGAEVGSRGPIDSRDQFVPSDGRLVVVSRPTPGIWTIASVDGRIPYAIHTATFHPAILPNSPPSPGATAASPFKCRACKTTAKALALALVAGAALPVLPQALIAAVSTYLGATTVIATAFIQSVLGDAADVIAEKLCKKVGLC